MKRIIVLAAIVALGLAAVAPFSARMALAQDDPSQRDVLILLDVTRSMRGQGDPATTPDIWDDVSARVIDLIQQQADGSWLAIVPFAQGPILDDTWPERAEPDQPLEFAQMSPDTKAQASAEIEGTEPDGQGTHICPSLDYAYEQMRLRAESLGAERTQLIYLYTDGDEEYPECADNFYETIVERYGASHSDYPNLHTFFVNLAGTAPDDTNPDDGITVVGGIPDNISVELLTTDLGNLQGISEDQPLRFRVTGDALADGQERPVNIQLDGSGLELVTQSALLTSDMIVEVRPVGGASGDQVGVIRFDQRSVPAEASYLLVDSSFSFHYAFEAPTPTPTLTPIPPTPTPEPTATATPSATSTPAPTATPAPSPTPAPNVQVVQEPETEAIGAVTACSDTALVGQQPVTVVWDAAAVEQGTAVEIVAMVDGVEDSSRVWFDSAGARTSRLTITPDVVEVPLFYSLDGADDCPLWHWVWPLPWPGAGSGQVNVTAPDSGPVGVQFIDADGQTVDQLEYGYTIERSFGVVQIIEWLLLAGLFFVLAQARFPKKAIIEVQGQQFQLRRMSQRSLRWFRPGEVPVDGARRGIIDVRSGRVVGYLTPRRSPLTLFKREVYIRPVAGGEDAPLQVNGNPISRLYRLPRGTTVDVQDGESFTRRS